MNDEHGFINRGAGILGFNNMRKKINLELRRRGYDPRLFTEGIGGKRSASIVGPQGNTTPTHSVRNNFRDHIMDFQNGDDNNPTNRSCEAHMLSISKKRQYYGPGDLDMRAAPQENPDFPKDSDYQNRHNLTGNPEEEVSDA